MDTTLILLTCASLAAAAVSGISAWRMRAHEAQRSAARVAALSAAIDASEPLVAPRADIQPVAVTSLFATPTGASTSGRPLLKTGVFAVLATVFVIVVAMANREHRAPVPAAETEAALELVSMHHGREGRTLTVSGLVRNPRGGHPRSRVDAVVFTFDRDGGFIASGRAALDFTNLGPGDESPFVVKLVDVSNVARYRVSFRTEAGMLRHIDRRDRATNQLRASTH